MAQEPIGADEARVMRHVMRATLLLSAFMVALVTIGALEVTHRISQQVDASPGFLDAVALMTAVTVLYCGKVITGIVAWMCRQL